MSCVVRAHAGEYKILLTSFDPFGGNHKNNTQAIVAALASAGLGSDVSIATCNLPVVYDKAAESAEDCIAREKPDAVISFGEADCSLRIETAATNFDQDGLQDNAGQIRKGSEIIAGAPKRIGFTFPVDQMYCAVSPEIENALEVSVSPGGFVCNNTAYHLSTDLSARGVPFTFIHVPNSRCKASDSDPEKNAAILVPMLKAAIHTLRSDSSHLRVLPVDQAYSRSFLSDLSEAGAPSCEIGFAKRILSSY